jgi:hypothetical protein
VLLRIAVHLAGGGEQEARALGLGEAERVVGAVGAHLERVQRQAQVVDRGGGGGEVVDEVHRLLNGVGLDDVRLEVEELGIADVLDVVQRPRLEVVHADDPMSAGEQLVAQVRPKEPGAAGDQAGGHGCEDIYCI